MSVQDVGNKLRTQREQRGVSLETAAESTRIRRHYLVALEAGDFGALPSAAQVRGFLRAYADFLELDAEELLAELKTALPAPAPTEPTEAKPKVEAAAPIQQALPLPAFIALGNQLRQRREQMDLTLLEVEEHTHIPEHYLARLEAGQFDTFPSPTQARGMLGNYAEFLGLESEVLLLSYAEALQERFQAREVAKPTRPRLARPKLPQIKFRLPDWAQPLLTRDIAFGALAGFLLLAFVIFSVGRVLTTQAGQEVQPTAPPLAAVLQAGSSTPGLGTPSAAPGTNESINLLAQQTATPGLLGEATIQVTGGGAINLRLLATQRTWMRVTTDGSVAFEGRTVPGQSYNFAANGQILLLTGNGSGLRAFLNDQDLGIVGVYGEVVNIIFNAQGAATPTLSPTPTIDPNILTATANGLLTPSATPSPTMTETPEPSQTPAQ
jgi:cytoskeletal protein RodZ